MAKAKKTQTTDSHEDLLLRWLKVNNAFWLLNDGPAKSRFAQMVSNAETVKAVVEEVEAVRRLKPDLESFTPPDEAAIERTFERLGRALAFDVFQSGS